MGTGWLSGLGRPILLDWISEILIEIVIRMDFLCEGLSSVIANEGIRLADVDSIQFVHYVFIISLWISLIVLLAQ